MRKISLPLIILTFAAAVVLAQPGYSSAGEDGTGVSFDANSDGKGTQIHRMHFHEGSFLPDPGEYGIPKRLSYKSGVVTHRGYYGSNVRSGSVDMGFSDFIVKVHHGGPYGIAQVLAAGVVSVTVHELGHVAAADAAGASSVGVDFSIGGSSLLKGTTTYTGVDPHARLPISMAGVAFSDIAFEHALDDFRSNPTLYNRSLMLFTGLDLLKYCLISFNGGGNDTAEDPIALVENTPLSRETLLTVAVTKALLNAYRVYSGKDTVIPYFSVGDNYAALNMRLIF